MAPMPRRARLDHTKTCCRCGKEPRVQGQSWGRTCQAAYGKRWRRARAQELAQLRARVKAIDGSGDAPEHFDTGAA